jgi:two-component system response regulator PilR (NtrC family)
MDAGRKRILVVEDDPGLRFTMTDTLEEAGFAVSCSNDGAEAIRLLGTETFDVVVTDLRLPGKDGMEILKEAKTKAPPPSVITMTGYGSIESAVAAMRLGAEDYLTKPFSMEEFLLLLAKVLRVRLLEEENRDLRRRIISGSLFEGLIGKSKAMQDVFALVSLVAETDATVLVLGESGTGKELVAKAIHHHSRRSEGPFVTVNSGSMPHDLLESNLFGHVKGAFTGAIANKKGLFELADDGSIFFDEIGNIPLETQAKLLRLIQEKEFMRLGGVETLKAEVRIIAATNAELEHLVQQGRFREDLYYRLNVITINLPPLGNRTEDIPLLARHFLAQCAHENEKPLHEFTPRAMELLMDYHWPGNVRELENVIERGVVLSTGEVFDEDLLPPAVREPRTPLAHPPAMPSNGLSFKEAVASYERELITQALKNAGGVQKRAADILQVKPTTLHEMMKRLGVTAQA